MLKNGKILFFQKKYPFSRKRLNDFEAEWITCGCIYKVRKREWKDYCNFVDIKNVRKPDKGFDLHLGLQFSTGCRFKVIVFKLPCQEACWYVRLHPFLSWLAKKLVNMSGDPRKQQWLHQRLSLAVVRGNAVSILACVQVWSDFSHPQCINQCCCAIGHFRLFAFSVSFIVFLMFCAFWKPPVQHCFAPL